MSGVPVVYATSGWGIHDERWVAALEACGLAVQVVNPTAGLRLAVVSAEPQNAPVLAGPIDTVAYQLLGLDRRVVGLSWGYDLQQGHARSTGTDGLSWIAGLDGLVVDNPSSGAIAESLGVRREDILLLPWGVDLTLFTPTGPVWDHGFPPTSRVVMSLRRHDTLYRTADVVEAFVRAAGSDPRLRLVLGGAGPLTPDHTDRLHEAGLDSRVRITGQIEEATLPALMRAADVYVTASETDGSSVTLLQAMACGLPVVASDIPGNRWWVTEGVTGRLFPVGDVDALARLLTAEGDDAALTDSAARALDLVRERADWTSNRLALRSIMLP